MFEGGTGSDGRRRTGCHLLRCNGNVDLRGTLIAANRY